MLLGNTVVIEKENKNLVLLHSAATWIWVNHCQMKRPSTGFKFDDAFSPRNIQKTFILILKIENKHVLYHH